jgi:hypothetical protein
VNKQELDMGKTREKEATITRSPLVIPPVFSALDAIYSRLTLAEQRVLSVLFAAQHALSPGEIQRKINKSFLIFETLKKGSLVGFTEEDKFNLELGKPMSWDLLMKNLDNLEGDGLVASKEIKKRKSVPEEKIIRAPLRKAVYYLSQDFLNQWQNRRIELLEYCDKYPKLQSKDVLGDELSRFYRLNLVDSAKKRYDADSRDNLVDSGKYGWDTKLGLVKIMKKTR